MTLQPYAAQLGAYQPVAREMRLFPLCHYLALSEKGKPLGKTPAVRDWPKVEFDHDAMVAHMGDGKNVGFKLGNGFAAIDYDPRRNKPGGSLDRLCNLFGIDLSKCTVIDTGGSGVHVILKIPLDWRGREQVPGFDGIEFKHSTRRYLVAAGSLHPGDAENGIPPGRPYLLRAGSPPIDQTAEAPAALLEAFAHLAPPDNARGNGPESFGNFAGRLAEAFLSRISITKFRSGADPSWEQIMMSAHWASGGHDREDFVAWCMSDPVYADHEEIIRKRWDSLEPKVNSIKTGLLFKALEREGVQRHDMPVENASVQFAPEDFEGVCAIGAETLPPGVRKVGQSTVYSLTALKQERGVIEPFLDGYLYGNPGGIYVLSGPPKTGKTQLTFSLLSAVAAGDERWMGNRLWLHGPIIWFSLESTHSLLMAMDAWEAKHGRKHPGHDPALFAVSEDGAGFMDPKRLPEIEEMCRGRKVAVIDTVTRALPGRDQNSTEFITVFYNQLSAIGAKTGTTFIVIHHPPKSDPTGQRGSGDIVGSADGVIALYRPEKDGPIKLEMQFIRFGQEERPIFVEIESVEVGYDDRRGRKLFAPFVVQADEPEEEAAASPLDEVAAFVRLHGEQRGDAYVIARARAREMGAEPKAVQLLFKGWRGPQVGNGYVLDLRRIGSSKAQEIVVRFGWEGDLSADELNDISGLT